MVFKWTHCVIFVHIVFIAIAVNLHDDSVEYYERIIREGIERSAHYVFPKDASSYKPKNQGKPKPFEIFDYIVIGGGSAGAVVASRLSEIAAWNILLLEAGEEENEFTDIPGMSLYTLSSDYNWGFNSTPQSTCCLATDGICPYPRGRALRGSTVINALIYSRGNALDYDKWSEEGNPGWSYKDVLPYFKYSEKSNISGDPGYHGTDGELNIEYHEPLSARAKAFISANRERGLPIGDYNGKWQLSASQTQFTSLNGKRLSSAGAFLKPAARRSNLRILTGSYATKIIITGKFRKARGVIFSMDNVEYYARAKREVILSAGVFGSPQLLMLSGIGPAEHLTALDIPVKVNLNVGQGMHDHLTFYNMYFTTSQLEPSFTLKEAIQQYIRGEGPLTISTNPQALSFHVAEKNSTVPDFEVIIVPSIKKLDLDTPSSANDDNIFQFVLVLLHPKTRGSVTLQSKDPYKYPLIDSKCLNDPEDDDIEMVYKGIQIVMSLMETEAFKSLSPKLEPYPPCNHFHYLSKAYWMCVIRQTSMNAFHAGGTCRMGPNPLENDVVDDELRVYGVTNLRIADASVIPITLSAHTSAPAMMIGEKLAKLIKYGKD